MAPSPDEITQLLAAWSEGQDSALEKLMPLVYDELRRKARACMRGQLPGHTLQTTALIHEAFLKLAHNPDKQWHNRAHFQAVAAQAMRQILVDYARSRHSAKREGALQRISWDENAVVSAERAGEFIALDDALKLLAQIDPRKSRVVELRFFGGMNTDEIAEVLRISPVTVMRDWRIAKTWLRRELDRKGSEDDA
jgi:RNA polymerase sigma factor (TIGR02999 family)